MWNLLFGSKVCKTSGPCYPCYLSSSHGSGLILPKAILFLQHKVYASHSSCVIQFWTFTIPGAWVRIWKCVSMLFPNISHPCQGLLLLQASTVIHQFLPGHCLIYFMISQHLEAKNLDPCLDPNAREENIEHFKVKASGGRVPEELA